MTEQERTQRKRLLARMAGNIASGILVNTTGVTESDLPAVAEKVGRISVMVAEAILDQLENP